MIDRMLAFLREQNMCVLATCDEDKPYCSLMAYVTDADGRTVYMVTLGNSRKYRNLTRNPHVSLLVDTRSLQPPPERGGIQALTVLGECSTVIDDATRKELLGRIAAAHPHTGELARQSDARLLAVRVNALLLLDGIDNAHFETLT
jgi:nitroimidazol reductase NimA-like FMN-containing flavoprotein (pyridoxamine 5'-phosphate oxidase superfamily)